VAAQPIIRGLQPYILPAQTDWCDRGECPICGSAADVVDLGSVRGTMAEGLRTSLCLGCQFAFKTRLPHAAWYEGFYAHDWDESGRQWSRASTARGLARRLAGRAHSLLRGVKHRIAPPPPSPAGKILAFCSEFLDPGATVLDIGCGFATFLHPFHAAGHRVLGIEPSRHRAAYVRDALGIPCEAIPVEELLGGHGVDDQFDLVLSNHVVEHLFDPNAYLVALERLLRPGGYAYIAVPNLFGGEHLPHTLHFAGHLSHFTLAALCRLITKHGFSVVKTAANGELQVVFKRAAGSHQSSANGRRDPWLLHLRALVQDAVTGRTPQQARRRPHRLLVWRTPRYPDPRYTAQVIPCTTRQAHLVQRCAGSAAGARGARLGARLLSSVFSVSSDASFLLVRLPGDAASKQSVDRGGPHSPLPVEFVYDQPLAPFWIK
jgi:2-polyprenyl-3-methyl-5-hydroxy-6-metoxy-1,4-benzoquinol methylase